MLYAEQEAQFLRTYNDAVNTLLRDGSITTKAAYFLTKDLYPDYPAKDEKEFMEGLAEKGGGF
jgi:hypothetical protein